MSFGYVDFSLIKTASSLMQKRPFIIPVFLPHAGCPHQCVFCNQKAITGARGPASAESAAEIIEEYLGFCGENRGERQISFYGGNFLGLKSEASKSLLETAQSYVNDGKIDLIRFSTRPDTISEQSLELIKPYSVRVIELGVQSMDDRVLEKSKRGHTARESAGAAGMIREKGYRLGLQMMTGLPGDSGAESIESARKIAGLRPDFVRIYPTVVLSSSPLGEMWRRGEYKAQDLDSAVALAKDIWKIFAKNNIPVIRMGLAASSSLEGDSILSGPYHPAFGHLVECSIFLEKTLALLDEKNACAKPMTFTVNPASVSRFRGHKNSNMKILTKRLGAAPLVSQNPDMPVWAVGLA